MKKVFTSGVDAKVVRNLLEKGKIAYNLTFIKDGSRVFFEVELDDTKFNNFLKKLDRNRVKYSLQESNLRKSIIKENMSLDSDYLQRQLKILADDMKRDEPEVAKAYLFIQHRINQSFPDGDVSREDVEDLLHEPQGRKHLKNMPEWAIDQLFESRKNKKKLVKESKPSTGTIKVKCEVSLDCQAIFQAVTKPKYGCKASIDGRIITINLMDNDKNRILSVIDRLPFKTEILKESKLSTFVNRIIKEEVRKIRLKESDRTRQYDGFVVLDRPTKKSYKFKYLKGTDSTNVENQAISKLMKKLNEPRSNFMVHGFVKKGEWDLSKAEIFESRLKESSQSEIEDIAIDLIDYLGKQLPTQGWSQNKKIMGFFQDQGLTDMKVIQRIYKRALQLNRE